MTVLSESVRTERTKFSALAPIADDALRGYADHYRALRHKQDRKALLEDAAVTNRWFRKVALDHKSNDLPNKDSTRKALAGRVIRRNVQAIKPAERITLTIASAFSIAVPITAVKAAANEIVAVGFEEHVRRLIFLGLIDRPLQDRKTGEDYIVVNPLARRELARLLDKHVSIAKPFALLDPGPMPLEADDIECFAKAALPVLKVHWCNKHLSTGLQALELARLAGAAGDVKLLEPAAVSGILWMEEKVPALLGMAVADWALKEIERAGDKPGPRFLRVAAAAAGMAGDRARERTWLARGMRNKVKEPGAESAKLWAAWAVHCLRHGRNARAEHWLGQAHGIFAKLGDKRAVAVNRGQMADLLLARGKLDEAKRIRTQEQLPIFEALGDKSATAVTHGKIADILLRQGNLDEALRIRKKEQLPTFTAQGDTRAVAVTRGQIADILTRRGAHDEVLHIRRQEQLPVFEELGDKRAVAITRGQIADILFRQGQYSEALRIRTEEQLPAFIELDDKRAIAVTQGKIADILERRGEFEEALRLRTEEQLRIFERLGDKREAAITRGHIADIMRRRGDLNEVLRMLTEEQLPIFTELGERRQIAITHGQIADVLRSRNDYDEALLIHVEKQLPIFTEIGDKHAVAITKGKIAGIHYDRGDRDEALRIRIEEQLPAFAALGDQRAVAATWGQIADIYVHAGDLDEALRIRREKQVPAFDRDTDKRPIAVALGKIADVVESQGDLDEALRIHRDERLPVYDALNDKHGLMHVYWRIARILRVKSVVREVAAEARLEPLISAYQLARELKRVDALGVTALELGDLLLSLHAKKEAEVVLRTAVASCEEQGVHDKQRQLKAKLTQLRTIPG